MEKDVEQVINEMKTSLLIDWERGWYQLGWRGNLALWLLRPVLENEALKFARASRQASTQNTL